MRHWISDFYQKIFEFSFPEATQEALAIMAAPPPGLRVIASSNLRCATCEKNDRKIDKWLKYWRNRKLKKRQNNWEESSKTKRNIKLWAPLMEYFTLGSSGGSNK